ncbi:MAG: pyridoxal phosphate-dependent aminotransferase [Myxococcota bacterium]
MGIVEKLAKKMGRLGTETAFEVLAKAKKLEQAGKEIVHLEIGEPDFDTPENIIEAGVKALKGGYTHYGPSAGLPILRETISQYINETRGIKTTPEMVVVTPGAKPIMFFAMLAFLDSGDEVIYPNPGFPIYESTIRFNDAVPVPMPFIEDGGFKFDVSKLESAVTKRTKMIIINSPQNPIGCVFTREEIKEIARVAKKHDLIVLSDEVYSNLIYDGEFYSIASEEGMMERTIILDGFSKTYAMTGWRVGFGVMQKEIADYFAKLQTNSNSCTASFSQIACVEAYKGPQDGANVMKRKFKERRDLIVEGLNSIKGFKCPRPAGAFYVFPDIRGTGKTSRFLEDYFLNTAGVACLSGTAFGANGEGYIRFSYANSPENIEKAIKRMKEAVKNL